LENDIFSTPQGGVIVDLAPNNRRNMQPVSHYANLADGFLDDYTLRKISRTLKDGIQADQDSRAPWLQMYTKGIKLLGLNVFREKDQKGYLQNQNEVISPVLLTQATGFVAAARAELLPPEGPVKVRTPDAIDPASDDAAYRVQQFCNILLTAIDKEFYPDCETAFFICALAGSVFKKTFWDPILKRPSSKYVPPEDFIINYGVTSLASAIRMTHVIKYTKQELIERQRAGFYKKLKIADTESGDDDAATQDLTETLDDIKGEIDPHSPQTVFYKVWECHCNLIIDEDNEAKDGQLRQPKPYIVTLSAVDGAILSIYRNWEENDQTYKRIECFTQYIYTPGLGFYGTGLIQLAGGLAQNATELTRLLVDSGKIATAPGGVRSASMKISDNDLDIGPCEWGAIDTGGMPIHDVIMPFPYKEPSQILLTLKEQMEKGIETFSGVVNQNFKEMHADAPLLTAFAFLDQHTKIPSSVMSRLHQAMGDELTLIYNLIARHYSTIKYPFNVGQNSTEIIMGEDFAQNFTIIPVSDPNLNSLAHRMMRNEAILKMAQQAPHLHNLHAIYKRIYNDLKVPNISEILPDPKEASPPPSLDPGTENMRILKSEPVMAYIAQDHQAHMIVHQSIMAQLSSDPKRAQDLAMLNAHIKEHEAFQYQIQLQQQMHQMLPPNIEKLPPQQQNQIAMMEAQAAQKMQQQQQQHQQPQVTPEMIMLKDLEIKQQALEQKMEQMNLKHQVDMQKLLLEKEKMLRTNDIKISELEIKTANEDHRLATERYKVNKEHPPI
jgi:hypothetical protein